MTIEDNPSWWEQHGVRPLTREHVMQAFNGTVFRFASRTDQQHTQFLSTLLMFQTKDLRFHNFPTRNSVLVGKKNVTFLGSRGFILIRIPNA